MSTELTNPAENPQTLRIGDWLLLGAFCLVLYGFPMIIKPLMGVHETIHCVNTREMLTTGDLVIPTHGGRPWLERPPLPFYLTGSFVALTGQPTADWPYRLGSIFSGLCCVFLVTAIATRWFGRNIGLLTGFILASMAEMMIYSSQSEADIVLCLLVTLAMYLFVQSEFETSSADQEKVSFFGSRPWPVLGLFVVLGLTNVAKGLFFGMLIVLAPIAAYLLLGRRWQGVRRYCWFWGWLVFLAVALPWPVIAYLRVPSIVELWKSDYVGRLSGDFMQEPWWYYLVQLPRNLVPWSFLAFLGLWLTRPTREQPHRYAGQNLDFFLWCWALAPIVWLSVNNGKHHHYLLHVTAPWGILAALGAVRFWRWSQQTVWLWRSPATGVLVLGLPISIAALLLRAKVPGPMWVVPTFAVLCPIAVGLIWWAASHPNGRTAMGVLCAVILIGRIALVTYWDRCIHRPKYAYDVAFMERVLEHVPPEERLFFNPNRGGLGPSWWLHYLEGRAELLHNITFLRADNIQESSVFVVARPVDEAKMSEYGTFERVFQSVRSKHETTPDERWTLYEVHFRPDLRRVERPPIDAMQGTNRAEGPVLK